MAGGSRLVPTLRLRSQVSQWHKGRDSALEEGTTAICRDDTASVREPEPLSELAR